MPKRSAARQGQAACLSGLRRTIADRTVLRSFARDGGKAEVIGAAIIIAGMAVGLHRCRAVGGLLASFGMTLFLVGRFARRVRQQFGSPRR